MAERVRLWREDYPHFAADPQAMVRKLEPLKPLVGKETLGALDGTWPSRVRVDELFESVMVQHYDPCYQRSTRRNFEEQTQAFDVRLESLDKAGLTETVRQLVIFDAKASQAEQLDELGR